MVTLVTTRENKATESYELLGQIECQSVPRLHTCVWRQFKIFEASHTWAAYSTTCHQLYYYKKQDEDLDFHDTNIVFFSLYTTLRRRH